MNVEEGASSDTTRTYTRSPVVGSVPYYTDTKVPLRRSQGEDKEGTKERRKKKKKL